MTKLQLLFQTLSEHLTEINLIENDKITESLIGGLAVEVDVISDGRVSKLLSNRELENVIFDKDSKLHHAKRFAKTREQLIELLKDENSRLKKEVEQLKNTSSGITNSDLIESTQDDPIGILFNEMTVSLFNALPVIICIGDVQFHAEELGITEEQALTHIDNMLSSGYLIKKEDSLWCKEKEKMSAKLFIKSSILRKAS